MPTARSSDIAIVIHGGAGTILRERLSAELEAEYRDRLEASVRAGYEVLASGGTSRDAAVAAVVIMEDSPLFNAGYGSVFNHDGDIEMDAAVMDGRELEAGAVAGIKHIKNPICLADAVLAHSDHVMLIGEGAEQFAAQCGFPLVENGYFATERRRKQLLALLQDSEGRSALSEDDDDLDIALRDKRHSTVGAVAIDRNGDIAAATSTGGMTNKRFGRVGDTPVIGAGTYADNTVGGISATGHGEFFIRAAVAHDICARALYKRITLQEAADEVVLDKLRGMGGDGGVVGIDPGCDIVIAFNSPGMYRAWIDKRGNFGAAIFR